MNTVHKPSTDESSGHRDFLFSARLIQVVGVAFLVALLARYGFRVSTAPWAAIHDGIAWCAAGVLVVDLLGGLVRTPERGKLLRSFRADFGSLLVLVLALVIFWSQSPAVNLSSFLEFTGRTNKSGLGFAMVQLFTLVSLCLRGLRSQGKWLARGLPAEVLLVGSFALLACVGTLLLLLPACSANSAKPLTFLEAFFTSTSASCVTGLTLRDTGSELSTLGQSIVMILFQIGGLGIIAFVGLGTMLSDRRFSLPQVLTLREVLGARSNREAWSSASQVIVWALVAEVIGCVALFFFLPDTFGSSVERWFWSLFHSISAFCNAGFSLQADSLEGFAGNTGINLVVMGLILLGGLGMPVARELLGVRLTRGPFFRRFAYFKRLHDGEIPRALSLQTKLSLWMTVALLLVGFVGFWALESGALLAGEGTGTGALISAFQSVTTRTAGFNSVSMADMQEGTKTLFLALMAIGAGPVSTGGGLKTVTFAILLITLRAMVTGRKNIEVAGRSIPRLIVRTAISVFVLYVLVLGLTVFALALTDPQIGLGDRSFEAVSALSTVGLSTAGTASFSDIGQLILCLAMFAGRIGPLALALSVFRTRHASAPYEFPEEELIVG